MRIKEILKIFQKRPYSAPSSAKRSPLECLPTKILQYIANLLPAACAAAFARVLKLY
jgi:hypothetical protein